MIGVIGLLGKIAEFLASDLSKRKLARDSDKRGQACQAVTRLYYLLVDLQAITDYVREGARYSTDQNRPEIIAFYIRDSLRRIKLATNDYFETFAMLAEPLEIYAPEVAEALSAITAAKFNILWEASQGCIMENDHGGAKVPKLRYFRPDDRLLSIDFAAYVKRVASGEAKARADRFEWPESTRRP